MTPEDDPYTEQKDDQLKGQKEDRLKGQEDFRRHHPHKKLPLWAVFCLDTLLGVVLLLVFCYFHHVRILWGKQQEAEVLETIAPGDHGDFFEDESVETSSYEAVESVSQGTLEEDSAVLPPYAGAEKGSGAFESTEESETAAQTLLDTSGDFGSLYPAKWIQGDEIVSLTDENEILQYAAENGLTLAERLETRYIALYRSHDIFMTVAETNTVVTSGGSTSALQYFVYDFYVRNLQNLCTSYSTEQRLPMETLIQNTEQEGGQVVAAVNGDFMGNLNYSLVCVRNGNVYRKEDTVSSDICVLYYNGIMKNYGRSEYNWESIVAKSPYQIWAFGPSLIDENGAAITTYDTLDEYVINNKHPRCVLGYYNPGHYGFLIVDGRSQDSDGLVVSELAKLAASLGYKRAYNMDGGDSVQAYVMDSVIREAEYREDGQQRVLWDIICVREIQ